MASAVGTLFWGLREGADSRCRVSWLCLKIPELTSATVHSERGSSGYGNLRLQKASQHVQQLEPRIRVERHLS